jgi:5'-nucleotidase/UDP-sugar diphosphatase
MDLILPFMSLPLRCISRLLLFCYSRVKKSLRSPLCFTVVAAALATNTAMPIMAMPASSSPDEATNAAISKWPQCDGHSSIQKISFVHVSDIHAHYNPDKDGSIPVARIRGYYEQVKRENPFTVFTDAGDDYEKGSIAEQLSQGQATREVVKAMRYDVRTLGNHDFAWGIEELMQFSHDPSAVVLATNTTLHQELAGSPGGETPGWTDFAVLTVGCVRIGFFGLLTKPWGETDRQYEGPYYSDIPALQTDFHYAEIAREVIARHRQEVDLLVMVSHLGLPDDIALAEQTDGIDLILGGHTHTIMTTPVRVKNTTIVHAGSFAEHIGRYDIDYDLQNRRITGSHFTLVDNRPGKIPSDERTAREVTAILRKYSRELYEPITGVSQDQSKRTMALIAARAAVKTLKVDAALVSEDSVWQKWRRGGLSQQDILNAFKVEREPSGTPGVSSLYLVTVTGEDLLHAITVLKDCVYWGPSAIEPAAVYTLAIQKPQAFNQRQIFGRTIGLSPPEPAMELWESVVAFARDREVAGLSLDQGLQDPRNSKFIALLQGTGSIPATKQTPAAKL